MLKPEPMLRMIRGELGNEPSQAEVNSYLRAGDRGTAVDGTLSACGLANRTDWIIATNDADDFLPLKHVSLVHEFL
jgi:hypothetical protein